VFKHKETLSESQYESLATSHPRQTSPLLADVLRVRGSVCNLPYGIVHTDKHQSLSTAHWTQALGQGITKKSVLTVVVLTRSLRRMAPSYMYNVAVSPGPK